MKSWGGWEKNMNMCENNEPRNGWFTWYPFYINKNPRTTFNGRIKVNHFRFIDVDNDDDYWNVIDVDNDDDY